MLFGDMSVSSKSFLACTALRSCVDEIIMLNRLFNALSNARQKRGNVRLYESVSCNDVRGVQGALKARANPNIIVNGRHRLIVYAIRWCPVPEIHEALIEAGADLSKPWVNRFGNEVRLSDYARECGRDDRIVSALQREEQRLNLPRLRTGLFGACKARMDPKQRK